MNELTQSNVQEIVSLHSEIQGHVRQTKRKQSESVSCSPLRKSHCHMVILVHGSKIIFHSPIEPLATIMRLYRERGRLKTESVSVLTQGYKLLTESKNMQEVYIVVNPSSTNPGFFYVSLLVLDVEPYIEGTRKPISKKGVKTALQIFKRNLPTDARPQFINAEPSNYNTWLYNSYEESQHDMVHGANLLSRNACNQCGGDADFCGRPEVKHAHSH